MNGFSIIFLMAIACFGNTQALNTKNRILGELSAKYKVYSDQQYSYSGDAKLNIPVFRNFAFRPKLGATFFTNKFGKYGIDELDYGLELCVHQSKTFPVSAYTLFTKEILYTKSEWNSLLRQRFYRTIYGHLRVGIDRDFLLNRFFVLKPGIGNWFIFNGDEINRVTSISTSIFFKDVFTKFNYNNISTKSRDDLQHSIEVSVGMLLEKDPE